MEWKRKKFKIERINKNYVYLSDREAVQVECRESNVNGAGEGLFAKKDLPAGTIVAFYNGIRLPFKLGGPKEEWESSGYKIFVNADFASGERMDIPQDMVSLQTYCATLGESQKS